MNQNFQQSISFERAHRSSIGCVWSIGFAPLAPVHYRIVSLPAVVSVQWSTPRVQKHGDTRPSQPI